MNPGELLTRAVGHTGRLVSQEPFGAGVIAGFEVHEGGTSTRFYVDTSLEPVHADTAITVLDDGEPRARVWQHPADPRLPALPIAATPATAATLLSRLGIEGDVVAEVIAYRPGRRAVVRLRCPDAERYLKIVPPQEAERIASLHRAFSEVGAPVPAVRGWARQGCLLIDAAVGTPGPDAALALEPDAILSGVDLARLGLARADVRGAARPSVATRVDWYADRALELLPGEEERIAAIRERVRARRNDIAMPQVVHGDLHLGQLFFQGATVSGLIDVDTAGVGDPADDSAAFIAHARTSARLNDAAGNADAAKALDAVADAAIARWLHRGHARAITAVHLLAHALVAAQGGAHERATSGIREAAALVAV